MPDVVGEAMARCSARGERQPRRRPRHRATASRRILAEAEAGAAAVPGLRAARGHLRREHDLGGLRALAHGRGASWRPATRSSRPRWTTTAASRRGSSWPRDRDLVVRHVELRPPTRRSTCDDLEGEAGPRARASSPSPGRRTPSGRSSTPRGCLRARARRRGARLDRRGALRGARADRRRARSAQTSSICSPYKFCGPHLGLAFGRAEALETLAPVQGAAGPDRSARAAVPHRHDALTSCSRASTRRSAISARSAAWTSIVPYERGPRRALRGRAPRRGLALRAGRGWRAASRRSCSTSTAWPAADVARAIGRARHRRLGPTTAGTALDLYRRLGYDDQAVRVGFIHYNTADEVDRFLGELERLASP